MEYYAARNGHINLDEIKISFIKFRKYFVDVYVYFEKKGYFKLAFEGHYSTPPLMAPNPEAFFFTHSKNSDCMYPIDTWGSRYYKEEVFTVIEILHNYIRKIDDFDMYQKEEPQAEFRELINKYLICLDDGYVLTEKGYIINLPDDGVGTLITKHLPENTDDTTTVKVETAIKMFFKYDANEPEKMKAINILADVLEPYRDDLEIVTTNKHDKLIFGIVNSYGIRHNNNKQLTDYDKSIWYEWMFHYYLATVHATLRLELRAK